MTLLLGEGDGGLLRVELLPLGDGVAWEGVLAKLRLVSLTLRGVVSSERLDLLGVFLLAAAAARAACLRVRGEEICSDEGDAASGIELSQLFSLAHKSNAAKSEYFLLRKGSEL